MAEEKEKKKKSKVESRVHINRTKDVKQTNKTIESSPQGGNNKGKGDDARSSLSASRDREFTRNRAA